MERIIEDMMPGALAIMRREAEAAIAEARPLIPWRTSALRDSLQITTDVTQKGGVSLSVHSEIPAAKYGHFSRYTADELEAIAAKAKTPEAREKLRRKLLHIHGHGAPREDLVLEPALSATIGRAMKNRKRDVSAALYGRLMEVLRD